MNSTDAPHMIEYATKSLEFTPHDTKWMPGTARIACCGISPNSKGALQIYELERDGTKEVFKDLSFNSQGIKCATFGASRLLSGHLAMGDYSGSLCIWDIQRAVGNSSNGNNRSENNDNKNDG